MLYSQVHFVRWRYCQILLWHHWQTKIAAQEAVEQLIENLPVNLAVGMIHVLGKQQTLKFS